MLPGLETLHDMLTRRMGIGSRPKDGRRGALREPRASGFRPKGATGGAHLFSVNLLRRVAVLVTNSSSGATSSSGAPSSACHVLSCHHSYSLVRLFRVRSGQVRSGQVRSGQVIYSNFFSLLVSCHALSGYVMSCHVASPLTSGVAQRRELSRAWWCFFKAAAYLPVCIVH